MVGGGGVDNKHAAAAAALAQDLPGFSIFFDQTGLEAAAAAAAEGEGGQAAAGEEDLEELEWLSNKDAFPSVETMAVEAEQNGAVPEPVPALYAPSWRPAVGPRTKGLRRRRRVTAPWSMLTAPVLPAPLRCTHCESEVTPQWRQGPLGPRTLCNACGVRYNTGRLLPEYRPANSPTFSPLLHSNSHRRVLRMRLQSGSEGEGASPAVRANAKARRAERAAARLVAKIKDGALAPAPAPAPAPAQTPAPLP